MARDRSSKLQKRYLAIHRIAYLQLREIAKKKPEYIHNTIILPDCSQSNISWCRVACLYKKKKTICTSITCGRVSFFNWASLTLSAKAQPDNCECLKRNVIGYSWTWSPNSFDHRTMDTTNSPASAQRRDAWGNVLQGRRRIRQLTLKSLDVLLIEAFNYKTFTLAHR